MTAARESVKSVDFAVPNHATIGPRFPAWQDAVDHARKAITHTDYPGQTFNPDSPDYHPRRFVQEGHVLTVFHRAFVHMRTVTVRPDGGSTDDVALTWEVFRDGAVELMPR
jgi:hypothetical protein